jgi:hypothetical protein
MSVGKPNNTNPYAVICPHDIAIGFGGETHGCQSGGTGCLGCLFEKISSGCHDSFLWIWF